MAAPGSQQQERKTEVELVEEWRFEALFRAGYPVGFAQELAARTDVDLHRAVELLRQGCEPHLAAAILL